MNSTACIWRWLAAPITDVDVPNRLRERLIQRVRQAQARSRLNGDNAVMEPFFALLQRNVLATDS